MKNLVTGLVIEGILSILIGVLIFIYPDLLGMLVGLLLIVTGVIALIYAVKLNKYTKLTIKV
ncbi:MAG: hypothetical protein GF365_02225 [Candidatus Buchananbacteria bacterium]|nr:hypothetical protein [Candidatus Buchananbacteria bacterium]